MNDIETPEGWERRGDSIEKTYEFADFDAAIRFMTEAVAPINEAGELLLDDLAEAARLLETRLLLVVRLAAASHHPRELVAVDDVDRAELPAQVRLLV